jgi:hypothetical protein
VAGPVVPSNVAIAITIALINHVTGSTRIEDQFVRQQNYKEFYLFIVDKRLQFKLSIRIT